ncbi:hypothetical protein EOL94_03290, partial [bacterium]|nr:hypothetical protein [bacterium]
MRNNKKLQFNFFIVFFITLIIFSFSVSFFVFKSKPLEAKSSYPKLANYFLKWKISESEAIELAKWDLLVLDMENQENNPEMIRRIRRYNPDIKILAYITSQEIIDYSNGWFNQEASLREELYKQISNNWWLKDFNGNKISFWNGTYMLNISDGCGLSSNSEKWNDFLPRFVKENILNTGLWDGVFYDNVWGDVSWLNSNINIKNGDKLSKQEVDNYWNNGMEKILEKTRQMNPDSIILGNGRVFFNYQEHLNGMMLEDFPSSWENGGTWSGSIETYNNLKKYNKDPQSSIILRFGNDYNYKSFRFGLTSALLNDGYFGYNLSQNNQGQLWWFDEYNINLGKAQSLAYNLLDGSSKIKNGLWRRDFENGISITNSTKSEQNYLFKQEEFKKISGTQDPGTNNGMIVNSVSLSSEDGILLLKRNTEIVDSAFDNGSFNRVFDINGNQIQEGFFSYKNNYPNNSQIIFSDIDNDNNLETLVNHKGEIKIYKNGNLIKSFIPFSLGFKGEISMTISDLNGDGTKEIITGAGAGGGPHVRVFSKDGKPL